MSNVLQVRPIGFIHTPFADRQSAPRQPSASRDTPGTIELLPGHNFEHALEDLAGWDHVWVLFWFHLNEGWRPKVLPPRSATRRGVFATRSPYRPNPIGLSVLRLDHVDIEARVLRVRDVDMLDGTPVLDIKPYVAYADSVPHARMGWLDEPATAIEGDPLVGQRLHPAQRADAQPASLDPKPPYVITWDSLAAEQASWILDNAGDDIQKRVDAVLALGPQPHPYRRIRAQGNGFCLAVKAWRVTFQVAQMHVRVQRIATGYRASELAKPKDPEVTIHRGYVQFFDGR